MKTNKTNINQLKDLIKNLIKEEIEIQNPMKKEKIEKFLEELTLLSKKHGLYLDGFVSDNYENAVTDIMYDFDINKYVYDDSEE